MRWRLLEDVPAEDVRRVLEVARRRTFDRREIVFHQGDIADALHLVGSGHFAVQARTPSGDAALLAVRGPGEAVGELALVAADAIRSATVLALEPGETFAIYRDDFHRLRVEYPSINTVLVALLAEDVRGMNERLLAALFFDATTRVRHALLEFATVYEGQSGSGEVVIPLTQDDLATLAGVSRPTVNRVLRREEARGRLALRRGAIAILKRDELARGTARLMA
jgi:CRP/FNR family cyclic AMP-dependent transcriptional regulator